MIDPPDGTVEVENPAEVLRSEDGVFDVTSPYGYVFQVTCRRGSKLSLRQISEPKCAGEPGRMIWRIRRFKRAVASILFLLVASVASRAKEATPCLEERVQWAATCLFGGITIGRTQRGQL
jgi:hypothetical protein